VYLGAAANNVSFRTLMNAIGRRRGVSAILVPSANDATYLLTYNYNNLLRL